MIERRYCYTASLQFTALCKHALCKLGDLAYEWFRDGAVGFVFLPISLLRVEEMYFYDLNLEAKKERNLN